MEYLNIQADLAFPFSSYLSLFLHLYLPAYPSIFLEVTSGHLETISCTMEVLNIQSNMISLSSMYLHIRLSLLSVSLPDYMAISYSVSTHSDNVLQDGVSKHPV